MGLSGSPSKRDAYDRGGGGGGRGGDQPASRRRSP